MVIFSLILNIRELEVGIVLIDNYLFFYFSIVPTKVLSSSLSCAYTR